MRPTVKSIAAAIGLCWAAYCGPYDSNAWPLAFGMTPQQAGAALGMPLTYYSGPRGSEIYVASGWAGVPGRFPVDAAITLQFRRSSASAIPPWRNARSNSIGGRRRPSERQMRRPAGVDFPAPSSEIAPIEGRAVCPAATFTGGHLG